MPDNTLPKKLLFSQVKGQHPPGCCRSILNDVTVHDCQFRCTVKPFRDACKRLLWSDKTCFAHTQLIMSWKALILLIVLRLLSRGSLQKELSYFSWCVMHFKQYVDCHNNALCYCCCISRHIICVSFSGGASEAVISGNENKEVSNDQVSLCFCEVSAARNLLYLLSIWPTQLMLLNSL